MIRQTVLSVSAPREEIPSALHTAGASMTRRADGSYTLAISGRGHADVMPQLLCFAPQFLPVFQRRWRNLAPGGLEGLRSGHERHKRWRLDQPTPMERMWILDPKAAAKSVALTYKRAVELVPALKDSTVTAAWAGYVGYLDSTPDGVPGIGEMDNLPGLVLAAGFSGHGFGIAPGADHLIAGIVSGKAPIVNPQPYHPNRFQSSAWGKVAEF